MKPKLNYIVDEETGSKIDQCQSPPYVIKPLLPYLDRSLPVWEAAQGNKNLVNALKDHGFKVYGTDILTGINFLRVRGAGLANGYTHITNPPYGKKFAWIRHCFYMDQPFALLVPVETIGAESYWSILDEYGIDPAQMGYMIITPRVNFIMPDKGDEGTAQFPTMWLTWRVGPTGTQRVRIPKADRDGWK